MSTRIDDLNPDIATLAKKCIAILEEWKIPHAITSTLRTADEQAALFAQGRDGLDVVNALRAKAGMPPIDDTENARIVTNCDGVRIKSNHQSGRAVDIVPTDNNDAPVWPAPTDPRWMRIAEIMRGNGWSWGGDWTQFPDYPHYEVPLPCTEEPASVVKQGT